MSGAIRGASCIAVADEMYYNGVMSVTYKPVVGFPGYRVGDDGSVWTCRIRRYRKGFGAGVEYVLSETWTQMRLNVTTAGYLDVQLFRDRKSYHRLVHRLVLEAFIGPCPKGHECAHDNNDPGDNRLSNLSWKTKKANQGDRIRHGTHCRGERHGIARLTDEQASQIRQAFALGTKIVVIAKKFGVSRYVVSGIVHGETYRHG